MGELLNFSLSTYVSDLKQIIEMGTGTLFKVVDIIN